MQDFLNLESKMFALLNQVHSLQNKAEAVSVTVANQSQGCVKTT